MKGFVDPVISAERHRQQMLGTRAENPTAMKKALLEEDELRRWLTKFRFDQKFRGDNCRVPITAFADFVSISPQQLYKFMHGAHLRYDSRSRVKAGVRLVLERGLRWRRRAKIWARWMPDGSTPPLVSGHDHSDLFVSQPTLPSAIR